MPTAGETVVLLLDQFWQENGKLLITIVETGCLRSTAEGAEQGDGWSTLRIAQWAKDHPGCPFYSLEINPANREVAWEVLASHGLRQHAMIMLGESTDLLTQFPCIDFVYLDTSDDLNHGLAEFQAAEKQGARMIVMDDIATKAALAINYAVDHGWRCTLEGGRLVAMRKS